MINGFLTQLHAVFVRAGSCDDLVLDLPITVLQQFLQQSFEDHVTWNEMRHQLVQAASHLQHPVWWWKFEVLMVVTTLLLLLQPSYSSHLTLTLTLSLILLLSASNHFYPCYLLGLCCWMIMLAVSLRKFSQSKPTTSWLGEKGYCFTLHTCEA